MVNPKNNIAAGLLTGLIMTAASASFAALKAFAAASAPAPSISSPEFSAKQGADIVTSPATQTLKGFRLFIKLDKHVYNVGQAITLNTYLKNVDKASVEVERTSSLTAYSIQLLRPSGGRADYNLFGKDAKKSIETHTSTLTLKPGQAFLATFELSKLFDMTDPGIYKVWVLRKVNSKKDIYVFVNVISNEAEINVVKSTKSSIKVPAS